MTEWTTQKTILSHTCQVNYIHQFVCMISLDKQSPQSQQEKRRRGLVFSPKKAGVTLHLKNFTCKVEGLPPLQEGSFATTHSQKSKVNMFTPSYVNLKSFSKTRRLAWQVSRKKFLKEFILVSNYRQLKLLARLKKAIMPQQAKFAQMSGIFYCILFL